MASEIHAQEKKKLLTTPVNLLNSKGYVKPFYFENQPPPRKLPLSVRVLWQVYQTGAESSFGTLQPQRLWLFHHRGSVQHGGLRMEILMTVRKIASICTMVRSRIRCLYPRGVNTLRLCPVSPPRDARLVAAPLACSLTSQTGQHN